MMIKHPIKMMNPSPVPYYLNNIQSLKLVGPDNLPATLYKPLPLLSRHIPPFL